jgi:DNA-binding transcriptional ArsR family regulator
MAQAAEMIGWLRAAGEPSRLRLLALCERGDLSVSDLAEALGQSEPRVCRHLRILSEAGLIERLRNGQWVHYRIVSNAPAASFVKGLLAQVDRHESRTANDSASRTTESRLGRTLRDFVEQGAPPTVAQSALVVGVDHLELLEVAASLASGCTAIAHSRRAAQAARAFAERRGFNCRVLLAAGPELLSERDLTRAGQSFDIVILDHLATAKSDFSRLLACGRRALSSRGQLWLFERYESLEISRGKVVEHPLARLRRLLGDAGLSCERLSPIEADDEHVLAAVAAPEATKQVVHV